MERLLEYFSIGVNKTPIELIGSEVETSFVGVDNNPISTLQSQNILKYLISTDRWMVLETKGSLISSVVDRYGNRVLYELGRQNLEVATIPQQARYLIDYVYSLLGQLYKAGESVGARPRHRPIIETDDDLLVIPDERDQVWVELDGRPALNKLARVSSVQFTFSISSLMAIQTINKLGQNIDLFLSDYPQDVLWKEYIEQSYAGYQPNRYGGDLQYSDLKEYCLSLSEHKVICGSKLLPLNKVKDLDVPLFTRSVWWHFRLRRYGNTLCVEVRPMARRQDGLLERQLNQVLNLIS